MRYQVTDHGNGPYPLELVELTVHSHARRKLKKWEVPVWHVHYEGPKVRGTQHPGFDHTLN